MSIRSINFGNQVGVNNHIGYTSNPVGEQTVSAKTQEGDKSKLLWAGLAGLAAIATAGVIYVATRGKGDSKPVIAPVKKPIEQSAEQIKEMAIDVFKKAGNKFEKGKAITATGEGYTGTLTHTNKDGNKFIIKYKDGILQKSTKLGNDGETVFAKNYSYDADNNLIKVETTNKNGELIADFKKEIDAEKGVIFRTRRTLDKKYISVQDIATGKMIQVNGKQFYYTKEGSLRATRDKDNLLTVYHSNGKPKLVQDEYGAKFYDENGNLACEINTDFHRGARDYFAKYPDRKVKYEVSSAGGLSKDMVFYAPDSSRPNVRLSKYLRDGKWYPSGTVNHGGNRYNINIDDEIWDVSYGSNNAIKNIAKYNPKNGEVELLDSSVTKETVQNVIEQIKKAASSVKQEHRAARQMIREYQDAASCISKNASNGWRDSSFIF